jgi:ATP-dependent Lon protease
LEGRSNNMSYLPRNPPQYYQNRDILGDVKARFDSKIYGYQDVKDLILKIIRSGIEHPQYKPVHLILDGKPATGKTYIIQQLFEAIGKEQCIYYDATMSTQVGMLDYFMSLGSGIKKIRYVCLDELDKMKPQYQFGVLNATELGMMKETKYNRHREADTSHMTFFATSNDIMKVIEPLRTRFLIYPFRDYTKQEFYDIAFNILTKEYDIRNEYAVKLITGIDSQLPNRTIRTVKQIAKLVENDQDINQVIAIFKRRREFN